MASRLTEYSDIKHNFRVSSTQERDRPSMIISITASASLLFISSRNFSCSTGTWGTTPTTCPLHHPGCDYTKAWTRIPHSLKMMPLKMKMMPLKMTPLCPPPPPPQCSSGPNIASPSVAPSLHVLGTSESPRLGMLLGQVDGHGAARLDKKYCGHPHQEGDT